jgi:hypothetical protein
LVTAASGCTGAPPALAEVHGKVTLNGAPLAGAVVTFYPDTEAIESPHYSRGITDDAGVYQLELASVDGKRGAVVGKHRVVVNWPLEGRGDPQRAEAKAKTVIPLPYTVAGDTPLRVEVTADGAQTIDLPLKGKGKR